jgi:hypothetical protein
MAKIVFRAVPKKGRWIPLKPATPIEIPPHEIELEDDFDLDQDPRFVTEVPVTEALIEELSATSPYGDVGGPDVEEWLQHMSSSFTEWTADRATVRPHLIDACETDPDVEIPGDEPE